jgi:uncharacterized DUF497 family protein
MWFEFDPAKEQANIRKHGLDFSVAAAVFADPLGLSVYDQNQDGEDRYRRFGAIGANFRLIVVVHAFPDPDDEERVRIISIRAATRLERREYEEANE